VPVERRATEVTERTQLCVAQHLRGVFQSLEGAPTTIQCDFLSVWFSQQTRDLDRFRIWIYNRGAVEEARRLGEFYERIIEGIATFEVELRRLEIRNHRELLTFFEELKALKHDLHEWSDRHRDKVESEYRALLDRMRDIKEFYSVIHYASMGAARLMKHVIEAVEATQSIEFHSTL
jgi:hypothetical protein